MVGMSINHDTGPGQVISNNVQPYEIKGVYLDDALSGITVRRNLFLNVMRPVFIGGGRDNEISMNIFLKPVVAAIHVDDRGLTWGASAVADPNYELRKRLAAVPYEFEPYRSRYPGLVNILNDDPGSPKNNRIGPNIVLGGKPYEFEFSSAAIMRLQKFETVLDERSAGVDALNGSIRIFPNFSIQNISALAPPFDLPFTKMDRKSALKDLKFITRSMID